MCPCVFVWVSVCHSNGTRLTDRGKACASYYLQRHVRTRVDACRRHLRGITTAKAAIRRGGTLDQNIFSYWGLQCRCWEGVFSIYPGGGEHSQFKNRIAYPNDPMFDAFRKCNNYHSTLVRCFTAKSEWWVKQTNTFHSHTDGVQRQDHSVYGPTKTHKLKYIPWLIPLLLLMRIPFLFSPFDEGLNNYSQKK